SGTLTFAPGETSKRVDVQTLGDAVMEPTETFTLTLSNASGATIARATGTATIIDVANQLPALTIIDTSVLEGNSISPLRTVSVLLALSAPSSQAISVEYRTVDGTATGGTLLTPVRPDYITTSGLAVIAPGQTTTS